MKGFREVPCLVALVMTSFICVASPIVAQTAKADQLQGLAGVGQQAIDVVLRQIVLDSTTLIPKTGKPLTSKGIWSVDKKAPAACPQTNDSCVKIFYRDTDGDVTCEWVVLLMGDGSEGTILDQNEDATRYVLRRLNPSQAAELVVTRKKPIYPPIAAAAHVSGPVVLRVIVSGAGTPEKVIIVSGPEMLRASAADGVKGWVFKPLMAGTQPVRFQTDVTFDFKTFGPSSSSVTSKP